MKPLVLIVCLAWSASIYSQTYYPLIQEDRTWNVLAIGLSGPPPWDTTLSTVSYRTYGDTVVNAMTYNKIYSSWEEIPVNWNLWCLMREDGDKKVWMRYKSEGEEFLMYDFSVDVGDSLLVGEEPVFLFVDSITTVMINGTQREKYWLSCKVIPEYHETWTEGIGSDKGIVWSGSTLLVGGSYSLLCMSDSDELIYMNPEYTSCYIISTGIAESWVENIRIYPNPASDNLIIQGLDEMDWTSISILDLSGRMVLEFETGSRVLNIKPLSSGIYLLKLTCEYGEIVKKSFVVN